MPSNLGLITKCGIHNENVYFPYDQLSCVIIAPRLLGSFSPPALLYHAVCPQNVLLSLCKGGGDKEAPPHWPWLQGDGFYQNAFAITLATFIAYIK